MNKIVESKESFILIMDKKVMYIILKDEVRFSLKGLEVQFPPKFESERTIMVRNVDSTISVLSEEEIAEHINKKLKIKRVIQIPNSDHLLKIVFSDVAMADKAVQKGLRIQFQVLQNRNIEKEVFLPLVPCCRCYNYEHLKKNCPKGEQYKICSTVRPRVKCTQTVKSINKNALAAIRIIGHWQQSAHKEGPPLEQNKRKKGQISKYAKRNVATQIVSEIYTHGARIVRPLSIRRRSISRQSIRPRSIRRDRRKNERMNI